MTCRGQGENIVKLLQKFLWFRASGTDQTSSNMAKDRLKLALTYDRGGLPRGAIEQLRDEIIDLIAKHLSYQPRRNSDQLRAHRRATTN